MPVRRRSRTARVSPLSGKTYAVTVAEVGHLVGFSRNTIERIIRDGSLEAYRVGSDYRIPAPVLRRHIATIYDERELRRFFDVVLGVAPPLATDADIEAAFKRPYFSVAEIARLLRATPEFIRQQIRDGLLTAKRESPRRTRITVADAKLYCRSIGFPVDGSRPVVPAWECNVIMRHE
jgi:excisionase family DNA binding protein